MKENWFWRLSLLIEKYYIETFTLEILVIISVAPTLRLLERIAIGVVLTLLVVETLKFIFKEKRPKAALKRKFYKNKFSVDLQSFPSAHAAIAMTLATISFGSPIFIPIFIFGVIVAYSRVYIKSHYPHDVIAGGLIGFLLGYALLLFF
jgi:undecaprenyl-diphosphatase